MKVAIHATLELASLAQLAGKLHLSDEPCVAADHDMRFVRVDDGKLYHVTAFALTSCEARNGRKLYRGTAFGLEEGGPRLHVIMLVRPDRKSYGLLTDRQYPMEMQALELLMDFIPDLAPSQ